jgi:large subunit ribosomal protein L20
MPRVTKSVTAKAKHKKVLSATKGHYGARSRLFKTAKQSNIKSLQYAFRDRKNRKGHLDPYGLLGLMLAQEN